MPSTTLLATHLAALFLSVVPLPSAFARQETAEEPATPALERAPLLEQKKLSLAMQRLASEYPDLVSVLNVGHSRSGRMFEALRLASGELTPGRPAILIVANLDGPFVYTSGVALGLARTLAEGYGRDEKIGGFLDTTTLYLIPRANPDGAEARFGKPLMEVRATGHGVDDDRDGRSGEDGPSDLDGDGMVSWMRISDPAGEWVSDPTDVRALVKADRSKGERGTWKLVREGRDSDGDEEVAEDPEQDAVINRNFPQDFVEHDPRSGLFATDEPEARALCEFVIGRKDIQLVLVWGELDNLVAKQSGVESGEGGRRRGADRVPPSGFIKEDLKLIEELGKRYAEINAEAPEGSTEWEGSFQSWCYAQRGLLTLSTRLWSIPLDAQAEKNEEAVVEEEDSEPEDEAQKDKDAAKPSDMAKRLAWIDTQAEAGAEGELEMARFLPWTPFEHPELGSVEIGGYAPYGKIEPPEERREELIDEQLEFLVELGRSLARVLLVDAEIRELGPGLIEARAVLENESLLPLATAAGRRSRDVRPAKVEIHIPREARLLAGRRQVLVRELAGAGGRHELRWLVRGGSVKTIGISVQSENAGTARYQEKP